jgi:hypothetical protein
MCNSSIENDLKKKNSTRFSANERRASNEVLKVMKTEQHFASQLSRLATRITFAAVEGIVVGEISMTNVGDFPVSVINSSQDCSKITRGETCPSSVVEMPHPKKLFSQVELFSFYEFEAVKEINLVSILTMQYHQIL